VVVVLVVGQVMVGTVDMEDMEPPLLLPAILPRRTVMEAMAHREVAATTAPPRLEGEDADGNCILYGGVTLTLYSTYSKTAYSS